MKRFLTSAKTALAAVAMTLLFALQGNAQDFNRIGLSYERKRPFVRRTIFQGLFKAFIRDSVC